MTGEAVLRSRRIRWQVPAALLLFVLLWTWSYFTLMPEPIGALKNGAVFVVVGFLGAIIGNVTAIGGGLIFIPILVFGYHLPAVAALKTSIATQAFGMTSGAIAWSREGKVPWRIVPWAIPGLLLGSSISSLLIHPSPALVNVIRRINLLDSGEFEQDISAR